MVAVTFCAGMTLPLLTRALMRRGQGEKAIGTIYSINTLGAIVGVLLTVHVLMPAIGIKGVILGGAALHIALGLSRLRLQRGWLRPGAIATAGSLVVLGYVAVSGSLDPLRVASSVFRTGIAALSPDSKVIYLRDGKTATISVAERQGLVVISTNGKPDAGVQMGPGEASSDEITMVLAAAIPLSMHPHPERVANIGFGSGLTTHVLLTTDQVKRLDSIEIEPKMVEGAREGYGPRIHNVFEDPRSHLVYEDAKTFFATAREPYDLIVSEPSNPWVSGVASLFSDEFYGRITHYLKPDGYFVQWMQIYETDISIVASVVKALSSHFGAYAVYNLDDANILIVATPGTALPAPTDRIFAWPQMRAELERIGVQSAADLQLRLIGDGTTLDPLLRTIAVPANSDFFPFVDLNAPRMRFMARTAIELPQLTLIPAPFMDLLRADAPRGPTPEPSRHSGVYRDQRVRGALAIRQAVLRGRLEHLDPATASSLLVIEAPAERCADPETRKAWQRAVWRVGALTGPYLNPSELAEVWSRIRSTPCYAVAGSQRTWADMLAAAAARDAHEIVNRGTELLQPRTALSGDELAYLTTMIAAAHIRLGELAQARSLIEERWSQLPHTGEYALPLRELLALSLPDRDPRVAQAGH
jgi:hypothetical protein